MAKIVLDRRGDLRNGVFYSFEVPFEDKPFVVRRAEGSIRTTRTPTDEALSEKGEETYLWISPWGPELEKDRIEVKDCPADPEHVTQRYDRTSRGETFGGKRLAPLIPLDISEKFGLTSDLPDRLKRLNLRGARLNEYDLQDHNTAKKLPGFWELQFVGRASHRLPRFVDVPNVCPHCGQGKLACLSCGQIDPTCLHCGKGVFIIESSHKGKDDKRIPFEEDCWWKIIEGKTWDGSDLIQTSGGERVFAAKRFIDWLLRVHAAPFYAEPVYFCVDGMNDDQQRWFKESEKPLEA